MSDDTTDTTAAVTTTVVETIAPVVPVPAPEPKLFNQDQLNVIVQQRLAADRATRKVEPKIEPKAGEKPPEADLAAEVAELRHRIAYEKRTAKFELDEPKSEAMFRIYKADPQGFDEAVALFGLKPPAPLNPSATGTTAPVVSPAAAPNAPAKVDSFTAQGLPNPFVMSVQQLDELGPEGCRAMLDKLTTVGRARLGTPPTPKLPPRR